jgi:adenylate cyclase
MPGTEIERKFLVAEPPQALERHPSSSVAQGYLAIEPGGTEVRVRRRDEVNSLTVKSGRGIGREETEIELIDAQFQSLWPLTEGRRVHKTRYEILAGDGLVIELDIYQGALAGLLVAEVEFPTKSSAAAFIAPDWFGSEVTGDPAYKNQALAVNGRPLTPPPRSGA